MRAVFSQGIFLSEKSQGLFPNMFPPTAVGKKEVKKMFGKFIQLKGGAAKQRRRIRTLLFCCLPVAYPSMLWAAEPSGGTENPRVAGLLAKAEKAIAVNRLTAPVEDSAVAYIERVLALAPENQRAVDLLNQVIVRYATLVDTALERGERARLRSLERAVNFRDRASRVITRYKIPSAALEDMDARIAAIGQGRSGQETAHATTADATNQMLSELVDRHVTLARAFFDRGDLQEAKWHASQAETLALRYNLVDPRLEGLKKQLALKETDLKGKGYAKARKAVDEDTRQRLTELAAFYVASSETSLRQGDVSRALHHKQAAEETIKQYGLSDEHVQRITAQLALTEGRSRHAAVYRVYGTF